MRSPIKFIFFISMVIFTTLSFAGTVSNDSRITIGSEFHTLWWSTEQMENIDLDKPPEKTTDVVIDKWEYSDPVGVPHPDSVDLLVNLTVNDAKVAQVYLAANQRWKIGSIASSKTAQWGKSSPINVTNPVKLETGKKTEVYIRGINLKTVQEQNFARNQWPWEMEIQIAIYGDPKLTQLLGKTTAKLPMTPGD